MKTIVGLYDEFSDAQAVVNDLVQAGIDRTNISLVANDREGRYAADLGDTTRDDGGATAGGAVTGAVVGGVGGVLLGLGALAIPGIGPVIAAGPLVAGLVGAGVGAAVGGLVGALVDAGVPEDEAGYYAEGVRRGSALVTVSTPDDRVNEVVRILDRHDPIDIDERVATWRQSGWAGFDPNAEAYDADTYSTTSTTSTTTQRASAQRSGAARQNVNSPNTGEEMKVEVMEEQLRVGKRQVEQGGVRIHKEVTETPVEEQVRLREEQITVDRRPVNRPANEADLRAFQEGDIEVRAVREEAVVEKQPRVVEEVIIRKDAQEHTETVRDTVRRTDVDIEQGGGNNSGYDTYASGYRQHFQSNFANRGYRYDEYEPAYRYGYTLANDTRYQGRDWPQIEADARRDWESNHRDSAWDDFKDAVRHGWQRVRQGVSSDRR